jgi:hypothetical protein
MTFNECLYNPNHPIIVDEELDIDNTCGKVFKFTIRAVLVTYTAGDTYIYWKATCDIPCASFFLPHPFMSIISKDNIYVEECHGVVTDNEVHRTILKFLAKPQNETVNYIGTTSDVNYRSLLLKALLSFWD